MRRRQKRFCCSSDELAPGFLSPGGVGTPNGAQTMPACTVRRRNASRSASHHSASSKMEQTMLCAALTVAADRRCLQTVMMCLPICPLMSSTRRPPTGPRFSSRTPLSKATRTSAHPVMTARQCRSCVSRLVSHSPDPGGHRAWRGCGGACLDVRRRAQMQLRIWIEQALQPRRIDARALPAVCMEHNQRSAAPKRRGMRPGARGRAVLLQLQRPVDSSRQAVVEVAATQEHDPDHGRARGKYVRQVHHGQQRACGTPRSLAPKRRAAILGAREDRAREDGYLVGRLVVRVPHSNVRRNKLFRPRVVTCSRCTGQRGNPGPQPHQTWGGWCAQF